MNAALDFYPILVVALSHGSQLSSDTNPMLIIRILGECLNLLDDFECKLFWLNHLLPPLLQ